MSVIIWRERLLISPADGVSPSPIEFRSIPAPEPVAEDPSLGGDLAHRVLVVGETHEPLAELSDGLDPSPRRSRRHHDEDPLRSDVGQERLPGNRR